MIAMPFRLVICLFAIVACAAQSGCGSDLVFDCTPGDDNRCRRNGELGTCLAPGHCAFSDSTCTPTSLRWDDSADGSLAGQCVEERATGTNLCGGTTTLSGVPGAACGACDSGMFACDGQDALRCNGEASLEQTITGEGQASASSVFSGTYPSSLGVDGDLSTSWFSSGPGGETDNTSVYSWINDQDRCIRSIAVTGNEFHATTNFRTNFGFGQLTVEVRDASDTVVFSKVESLPGTPDPAVTIDTGGVVGRSVRLLLQGHESNDCGGFAELAVNALL